MNGSEPTESSMPTTPVSREFFAREPLEIAPDLLGAILTWNGVSGRIVETEAYQTEGDEACHTFFRPSTREFVASHPIGTAYVYLNYGVHWLFNVLCRAGEIEGFVLVRALEPLRGQEKMRARRGQDKVTALCSGPGKLTQALGITGAFHGLDLLESPEQTLLLPEKAGHGLAGSEEGSLIADTRIGISRSADLPWRFLIRDTPHLSVKPSSAAFALPRDPRKAMKKLKRSVSV